MIEVVRPDARSCATSTLERHGGGWESARDALRGEGGWEWRLGRFAAHLTA